MSLDDEQDKPDANQLNSAESSPRTLTYSDIAPEVVSVEVYERTKDNLEGWRWEIFKVGGIPLRALINEGKVANYAHGSDTDEMLDYVPPIIEVAVHPVERTLEPINQPLDTQNSQLDQIVQDINHPLWLAQGEELEPEEMVEGVKAHLLPGAIVAQLAEAFKDKTGKPLLEDKSKEGEAIPFSVSCLDSPDGRWRLSIRPDLHTQGKFMISLWEGRVPQPQVRVLRALILPTPKE